MDRHDDPARHPESYESVRPDLVELCRIHDVGLELIRRSDDLDGLLDRVLEEYERRFADMRHDTLDRPANEREAAKLRGLVMFATQAAALREKAVAAHELRQRAAELQRLNTAIERALADEGRMRRRLDDVLAALDAGVLVVSGRGRIENANRAAAALAGAPVEGLPGRPIACLVGDVPRGGDGEVRLDAGGTGERHLLVARRELAGEPGAEVVLLSDVTARDRAIEEQHRVDRMRQLFRALATLSHEINNPLTSLMGRAQMLQLKKGSDPDVTKAAQVIEESAGRIAVYMRDLARLVTEGKEKALRERLSMELPLEPPAPGDAAESSPETVRGAQPARGRGGR